MIKFEFTCEGNYGHVCHGTVDSSSLEEAKKYLNKNYWGFHITKLLAVVPNSEKPQNLLQKISSLIKNDKLQENEIVEKSNDPDLFI